MGIISFYKDQIDLLIRDSTQGRNVLDECHEIIS